METLQGVYAEGDFVVLVRNPEVPAGVPPWLRSCAGKLQVWRQRKCVDLYPTEARQLIRVLRQALDDLDKEDEERD